MLTSDTVNDLNSTGVVLSGSFSQATSVPLSVGFEYGTSSSSLYNTVTVSTPSAVEGEFSTALSELSEGTIYYYRTFVTVSSWPIGSSNAALGKSLWLEMPAASTMTGLNQSSGASSSCHVEALCEAADESNDANTVRDRNYTYHYDKTTYTSLWIAYPLYDVVMGGSNTASWKKNPSLYDSEQIAVWSGSYGVNVGHTTSDDYNDSEGFMREDITYITPKCDSKSCPLPNYYWKVLLKVKRNGNQITKASTAGFLSPEKPKEVNSFLLSAPCAFVLMII